MFLTLYLFDSFYTITLYYKCLLFFFVFNVDVAIPENRIAIKVVGLEGYAKNDPYKVGQVRNCLSWAELHTRQLKAMRWEPVLIDAEAYKRIATSANRKDMLCKLLKMGEYAPKIKEENGSRKGRRKKKKRK